MSQELTNQIIRHIYKSLGLLSKKSITNGNEYLLSRTISFEDIESKIWGIQFEISKDSFIQILIADCMQNNFPEYAILVALEGTPSYATYLAYPEYGSEDLSPDRAMIACQIENNPWTEANVYMQAAFLCGMERLRDIPSPFVKLANESLVDNLVNFLKFYQEKMEQENEGQEV